VNNLFCHILFLLNLKSFEFGSSLGALL